MRRAVGNVETAAEDPTSLRARASRAGKSNRGAPGYSRWVNRPVGRQLAILAFRAGLTPNQVTMASAALTFTGVALLATVRPSVGFGVALSLLLATAYALDSADGQLARMRGGGTSSGEWLDHVVDCIKVATLHMAVLICWYGHFELPDTVLLVPILFGVQASVFFFTIILNEKMRPPLATPPSDLPASAQHAPVLRSLAWLPTDYGLLCWTFVLQGFPTLWVSVYAALGVLGTLLLLAALPKWYRDIARSPAATGQAP